MPQTLRELSVGDIPVTWNHGWSPEAESNKPEGLLSSDHHLVYIPSRTSLAELASLQRVCKRVRALHTRVEAVDEMPLEPSKG